MRLIDSEVHMAAVKSEDDPKELKEIRAKYDKDDMALQFRQAAFSNDQERVKQLLDRDPQLINSRSTGKGKSRLTALHLAFMKKHKSLAIFLLARGADPALKDKHEKIAFAYAPSYEFLQEVIATHKFITLERAFSIIIKSNKLSHQLKSLAEKAKVRVISIGCGMATEYNPLVALLGHHGLDYIGVEIDPIDCKVARQQHDDKINIMQLDATNIEELKKQLGDERFDLVILRHPDFFGAEHGKAFAIIQHEVIEKLIKPTGFLYVSCYQQEELLCMTKTGDKFCNVEGTDRIIDESIRFYYKATSESFKFVIADCFSTLFVPTIALRDEIIRSVAATPAISNLR